MNQTFTRKLIQFRRQLSDHGVHRFIIKTIHDRYFLDGHMVTSEGDSFTTAASIIAMWKGYGIGGVEFNSGISDQDLTDCIYLLSQPKADGVIDQFLLKQLTEFRHPEIILLSLQEIGIAGGNGLSGAEERAHREQAERSAQLRKQLRMEARQSFFQAVDTVQEVVVAAHQDNQINLAKTKRVVHSLIDHILRDESSLLELAAIRNFDDYTYAHSVNVCIYSLTLGVRLQLDRVRLSQLGFSALFHDIGKVKLPTDLIRKPEAYDEDDWIQMQRHSHLGAKTILRNLKLDVHTARAARVAMEHHIHTDFTGYPSLRYQKRPLDLFSRIVSVADTFDALTSGRIYIRKGQPADQVIKKMRFQMTIKFDPFLLKMFGDIIGIFPAGSLVLLNSEEIALVVTNSETDKSRPYVKIVANREGFLPEPEWADLSLPEQEHRKIIRQIDPEKYGLDLNLFILGD
jgi:HD-GYP domain-containing protein (c-di-GMP phosphodiesterase class II)